MMRAHIKGEGSQGGKQEETGGGGGGGGGQGSELTAVLKPDPRLLWDQFDQVVSTIDERPPDDPEE